MALRTIADLPAVNIDQIIGREDLMQNLEESLFEISYIENIGQYDTYKSKHIKFSGLSSLMMNSIIYNDFDFYSRKTFWDGINVSGELNLSGDFYSGMAASEGDQNYMSGCGTGRWNRFGNF